ncbi:eukaryotic translation initiation factor 2-alpha kinase-like [Scylla paramamosain]|uniref:eukaryotic translation initiation factor 2-alpha kinase-like n=1 Tax=Scylla paramamosain TaxID=85552 RepID=UPI0030827C47
MQRMGIQFQALPPPPPAAAAAQPQEGEEKALLAPNSPPSQDTLPTVERSDCSTEYTSRYLTDFEPVQRLARGGLGVVCQVRNKLDENEYAVKRINLPTNKSSAERVKREARALAKLNHANIVVRCYNSWPETPPQDGRTPKTPCIASKSPVFVPRLSQLGTPILHECHSSDAQASSRCPALHYRCTAGVGQAR